MPTQLPELAVPRAETIRGANDNGPPGDGIVTDAGAEISSAFRGPANSASLDANAPGAVIDLTDEELALLQPLISALARLAAKRLSATTISSGDI